MSQRRSRAIVNITKAKNIHATTACAYKWFFLATFPIEILSSSDEVPPPVALIGMRMGHVIAHPTTQMKIMVRINRR